MGCKGVSAVQGTAMRESEQPACPRAQENNSKKKKKKRKTRQQKQSQHQKQQQVGVEEGARGSVDPPQPDRTGTDPLLRGIFQIGKKSHDVVLTASRITWTPIEPDHPTGELLKPQEDSVELKDVFAVKVKRRRSVGQTSGGTLLGITLFTCRPKGAKLKDHAVHLNNLSADHCEIWFKQLKEILNGTIFTLFIMQYCYLQCFTVVCVGGDGSVAEVAHGLLLRAQMDAGRDTDSIFMPVQAALPLGVIPAASPPHAGRIRRAARHRQAVDVCSVSSMGRLLRFCFSVMFGFGSRTLAAAEKLTWIPNTQRREVAFITTLTNLKYTLSHSLYLTLCISLSLDCDMRLHYHLTQLSDMLTNLSLFLRLNNSSMALVAVGNASRSEFIKHLKRYSSTNNQFSFSFVETQCVYAVRLRPRSHSGWTDETSEENEESDSKNTPIISSEGTHPWNIDGELLEVPGELLIRVHSRILTLFGADVEEAEERPIKCSCI
uniref:Ceramide kinase-like n=1 Tax=Astyanax mexicanus TaxID=7994 RepID=A0A8B9LQ10_ASTMX